MATAKEQLAESQEQLRVRAEQIVEAEERVRSQQLLRSHHSWPARQGELRGSPRGDGTEHARWHCPHGHRGGLVRRCAPV